MHSLLLWLVLSALPQSPAAAGTARTGSVSGTVLHSTTSAPIGDVRVKLLESSREVRTAADGRFVFDNVPAGPATLTFSTIGFIFVRRHVEVMADGTIDLQVPLAEGTGTYEEAVTVVARSSTTPEGNTRELGAGALQDLRGVAADDPVRAVQALPGVATGDDFRSEFSVRGASFRQTTMVIDGVPTPLLFHAVRGTEDSGSIAMINSDVLSRASLSIGPHPQRHGNWLGGTLEFDMREGSRTRAAVRGSVSGTSAAFVAEGPLGPGQHGSWLVSLRKSYVDWLVRKIEPTIESTIGFADTQLKLAYDVTRGQQLELTAVGGDATYRKPTATGSNEILRATSTSVMATLALRSTMSRGLILNRLSMASNRFRDTGLRLQEQSRGRSTSWIWRSDATVPVRAWTLESGFSHDRQDEHQTLRDWQTLSNGTLRLRAEQAVSETRTLSAAYVQAAGRAAGVGVSAGVRASSDSRLDAQGITPWLLLDRALGATTFSVSASHAVQFPDLEQVGQAVTVAGQPPARLLPERATMVDAGFERALTPTLRWRVTGFGRRESDILRRTGENRLRSDGPRIVASRFPGFSSSLDGWTRGADLVLERRAATGPTGWIGYTWAHTRYRDAAAGEAFDGDYDQRHTLNVFVQQRISYRLKVHAKFRYGSNFPITGYFAGSPSALVLASTRNDLRLPAYARLDVNANRTFTFTRSRLTLFVEVMNATRRRNLGMGEGFIRNNIDAIGYTERLLPMVPSAGMLIEF
ncbi:MAG: carboxypeptidase regulatory-like domain-containing protein [Vicinamibacterales bacterium]